MNRRYYVDYENVHAKGLEGLDLLTKRDSVVVFYTANSNSMSITTHLDLVATKAKVEFIKVTCGTANALDFQLSSQLGYDIAKHGTRNVSYYIVSKDRGYNCLCDYWRKAAGADVSMVLNVSLRKTKEDIEPVILNILPEEGRRKKAIGMIEKHGDKQILCKALQNSFGIELGTQIYRAAKPFL